MTTIVDLRYVVKEESSLWVTETGKPASGGESGDVRTEDNSKEGATSTTPEEEQTKENKRTAPTQVGGVRKVQALAKLPCYPWVMFSGEVNMSILTRIRSAVVCEIHELPGSTAAAVRNAACPFMTTGEVLLVMEDLTRRGVFIKKVAPSIFGMGGLQNSCGVTKPKGGARWVKRDEVDQQWSKSVACDISFFLSCGWMRKLSCIGGFLPDSKKHGGT
ncbi:unnamed protein product [Choristocarpus tenellus]